MSTSLNNERDVFSWNLNKNKTYTVNSMYNDIMINEGIQEECLSWKIKVLRSFFGTSKK